MKTIDASRWKEIIDAAARGELIQRRTKQGWRKAVDINTRGNPDDYRIGPAAQLPAGLVERIELFEAAARAAETAGMHDPVTASELRNDFMLEKGKLIHTIYELWLKSKGKSGAG